MRLMRHQVDFINNKSPFVGLVGGFRAGKTYAAVHKAIDLAFKNPGLHGAILEPTEGMIEGTLMPVIDKVLRQDFKWVEGVHYKRRKSNPKSIEIEFPEGKTIIYLCGGENYARLAGKTLAWFVFDEIDRCASKQLAIDAANECVARLTNGPLVQGCFTSTPEGFHFMHHFFVENASEDRSLHKAKTIENPYVPDTYIKNIRATRSPKEAEAYLNGEFVNLSTGLVYYAFDPSVNTSKKTYEDFKDCQLHVGMDFNVGKMSGVVLVYDKMDKNKLYVIDEISGVANTEAMIKELKDRYPAQFQVPSGIIVYPDSSGKAQTANSSISSITLLKQAGLTCKYNSKNPSVMKERVPSVNAAFCSQKLQNDKWVSNHRLFLNIVKCPETFKGLTQQGFGANGQPDKSSGLDHTMDALGYAIWFLMPIVAEGTYAVLGK